MNASPRPRNDHEVELGVRSEDGRSGRPRERFVRVERFARSVRLGEDLIHAVAAGVAVDGSKQCIITGRFDGVVDFGGGPLTRLGEDVFVATFGP